MREISSPELDAAIEGFVVSKSSEEELLTRVLRSISKYVRIYEDGEVEIVDASLSVKGKVFLIVAARYLADRVNRIKGEEIVKNVSPETSVDYIARIVGKPRNYVSARLSDLEREGCISKVSRGVYTVASLNKLFECLRKLFKEAE